MILFGFWATVALRSDAEIAMAAGKISDGASRGGVSNNPSKFDKAGAKFKEDHRVTGTDDLDELERETLPALKSPAGKGALSELHYAVTEKVPYAKSYNAGSRRPQPSALVPEPSPRTESRTGLAPSSQPRPIGETIKDGVKEEDRLGARTRVGKCTLVFNGNSYWERALRTHEEHDKLHGYRLHVLRLSLLDGVWSKPAYILSLLLRELAKPEGERLEWLFWVDADTIILNPYVPIETFLPPPGSEFEDIHLVCTQDWNGLNNGIFAIRVNRWSVDLFTAILSFRYYRPDAALIFRDQSAMGDLIKEPMFAKHVVSAPQRWFNAYQGEQNETLAPFQIRRGDLLVHFAGVSEREKRMDVWLERAESHLDDWEVPLKSTSYPQEAREFWDEQRAARKNREERLIEMRDKATILLTDTDDRLNQYGDRLTDVKRKAISRVRNQLEKVLEAGDWQQQLVRMEDLTRQLQQACDPLKAAAEHSHKLLPTSPHEANVAGEQALVQAGHGDETSNPDLLQISATKCCNNADLGQAVNAVTLPRELMQEKLDKQRNAMEVKALEDLEGREAVSVAQEQAQAVTYHAAGILAAAPHNHEGNENEYVFVLEPGSTTSSAPIRIVTVDSSTATLLESSVVWTTASTIANMAGSMATSEW
ncbi:hypothetical protein LTR53_003922 [Teratosphaeriaceae sp. CCFEE 6253]|nr:hypothetical protein LTR53_003922 [Teratosphaeriaceae sp. CCFEE 6253]